MGKLQFVWWGRFPRVKFWQFPRKPSSYYEFNKKPVFYGLYFGIFEIRYFPGLPEESVKYQGRLE